MLENLSLDQLASRFDSLIEAAKKHLDEISAYNLELESDIALAETNERI